MATDEEMALINALGFDVRKAMSDEYTRGVVDGWNLAAAEIAKGAAIEPVEHQPTEGE